MLDPNILACNVESLGSTGINHLNSAIKVEYRRQLTAEGRAFELCGGKDGDVDTVVIVENQDQVRDKTKKLMDFEKRIILQTDSSLVTIDDIAGTGDIEAFR